MGVDESQIDDFVPRLYIKSKIKLISGYPCYTPEAAQRDVDALNALPILASVAVEYSGAHGRRQARYKLEGKPLTIRHVILQGYGVPAPCLESAKEKLNLKSGDTYRQSIAEHTTEQLEKTLCSQPGYWTEVREQDEPIGVDQIDVTFNVFVDPLQTIIIDGSKVE